MQIEPKRLFVEREFLRQLKLLERELLHVDIFERHHANILDEAIRAVNVPHPHIGHDDLKVEVGLSK